MKYKITNKRSCDWAGRKVLDAIKVEPFDLRIVLSDEAGPVHRVGRLVARWLKLCYNAIRVRRLSAG